MPYHDLICRVCGEHQYNVYVPLIRLPEPLVQHGFVTTQRIEFPRHCATPMAYRPPRVVMDAKEPFQRFDVQVRQRDDTYKTVSVDSVAKMRTLERESEQCARNGEGEAIRFRMWSQNASNGDVNAFGPDPSQPLDPAVKARFGLRGGTIKSVDAPEVELGPGVTDANVSALGAL